VLGAVLVGGVAVAAFLALRVRVPVRRVPTWGCGGELSARTEYTATAFSKPLGARLPGIRAAESRIGGGRQTRGEPIEAVLGTLQTVADDLERGGAPGFRERDTPLRHVLLRGVLLAFYGADVVRREESARRDRAEQRRWSDGETPTSGT